MRGLASPGGGIAPARHLYYNDPSREPLRAAGGEDG
jgi:hypothetical protein